MLTINRIVKKDFEVPVESAVRRLDFAFGVDVRAIRLMGMVVPEGSVPVPVGMNEVHLYEQLCIVENSPDAVDCYDSMLLAEYDRPICNIRNDRKVVSSGHQGL